MSKGVKKTGRRRSGGLPKRTRNVRPEKTTILIVGEGQETEPNYFDGLKREDEVSDKFAVTVKKGHGISPEHVIREAIDHKKRAESRGEIFDVVWCVLDVEGPEKRDSLKKAVPLARQNHITLCLSNPCFEVWLLAHFEKRARAYNNCQMVIVQLNKHWMRVCNEDYQKNDENVYSRLAEHTQTAIVNAKWVREIHFKDRENIAECNSATEVYKLIDYLTDYTADS
ncbi:MAG: RloB domain-containing protein [Planctomycetes bacterium]|nr:RloB domain-containing protein [Planctomycetota bacterium]